jgi:hypothetical protein
MDECQEALKEALDSENDVNGDRKIYASFSKALSDACRKLPELVFEGDEIDDSLRRLYRFIHSSENLSLPDATNMFINFYWKNLQMMIFVDSLRTIKRQLRPC